MAFIKWTESLSVKIDEIDNQHKVLIGLINDFYENIRNQKSKVLVEELIVKMREYTMMHFDFEEEMLKKYNYPDLVDHHAEHELFVNKVTELENKLKNNTFVLSFEVTGFLRDWLKKHILETDMQYAAYLQSKGISVEV